MYNMKMTIVKSRNM